MYSRQYEYVLSDAQLFQANIRALLKNVHTSSIDINASKTAWVAMSNFTVFVCETLTPDSPELLVLQDDPAFLPYNALPGMDIDLDAFGITSAESSRRSSLLRSGSERSSTSSEPPSNNSVIGLIIPSPDHSESGHIAEYRLPSEGAGSLARKRPLDRQMIEEELDDPGFSIDHEGNVIEHRIAAVDVPEHQLLGVQSESRASAQVSAEPMASLLTRPNQASSKMS